MNEISNKNFYFTFTFFSYYFSLGIKSIINLQCPKEHASCGQQLENSGFSYDPNIFMENDSKYTNAQVNNENVTLIFYFN